MQIVVHRPGYFGKQRLKMIAAYNIIFGVGKWEERWEVNGLYLPFEAAVQLYDQSYLDFLKAHPEHVDTICSYGECYDNDPSNVACGTTHDPLNCPRHIQDISVRRALVTLNRWFTGPKDKLLEIRSSGSEGEWLNPGHVPFYQPSLILTKYINRVPDWAEPESVEAFWQANKVIVTSDE